MQPTDSLALQLVEAAGLRDACDLDLLLFFSRHPRVVLSSEQLATYVGYELPQVARALDRLLGAGLLKRDGRNALKVLLKQRQPQNDPSHRRFSGARPS
jgi:hypothetical protein